MVKGFTKQHIFDKLSLLKSFKLPLRRDKMKKIVCAVLLVMAISPLFAESSVQNTPNIDIVDTPTSNTLLRGMYNFHMRFYESGGVLTRAWVGFANTFMIGATFNLDNVIGVGTITGREPKVLAKLRLIEDSAAFPALAVGYEPQAFGFYIAGNSSYSVRPIGAYAVVTKQLGIINLNGGINNHNIWTNFNLSNDLGIFAGATVMLNPDFAVLLEYNDATSLTTNSLNLGFRYAFAPELRIEVDIKGLTGDPVNYVRNLRIDYTNYF